MRGHWAAVVVALGALASCGPRSCEDSARPAVATARLGLRQIYDAGEWLRRVPVELAISLYARARLESFLDELDLPEEVHARLQTRVRAEDFVDELVPFLLFVRDMYQAPEGGHAETFDDHLRARFSPGDEIPGMQHSMFAWEKPEGEGGSGVPSLSGMGPEVAEHLLTLYDVLYLREHRDAHHMQERLDCTRREALPALEAATRLAEPEIRALLEALGDRMKQKAELSDALDALLRDDQRLEAASAALIRFVDQTVCRNYHFFAARAFRAQQLERWLEAELAAPGGGNLWTWLEHAQHERRYGVVMVVDGLEGRLLRALVRGEPDDPFVMETAREQALAGGPAPRARSLRAAPDQSTRFLESFAREGFAHPDYLPFFRALAADPRTHWLPVGVATTPTISVRNIPLALTGAPVAGPGGTGLPNFHFVDRDYRVNGEQQGRAYYFYGSDAVLLVGLTREAGMQTLFERLPQQSSMSCEAQYDERAQFGIDAMLNLGLGEALRDLGERLCAAELERRAENELELRELRAELLSRREQLATPPPWYRFFQRFAWAQERQLASRWIHDIATLEQRTLPELMVAYVPWPDHFAHFTGPFADEILAPSGELNRLDYWLGRWSRAYEKGGVLPRTVFGMAGDHGLTPVFHLLNPEVEIFDALRDEGVDFRVEKISSDEGEGPKLTNPFTPPSMKGIDVVVASTAGGNYMLDLFVDQEEGFTRQPLARDLHSVRPLRAPDAPPIDLLAEIAGRLADSLDYLAVREAPCTPQGGAVRLMGHRDGQLAQAVVRRVGDRVHLEILGADLLETDRETHFETLTAAQRRDHEALRRRCLDADVTAPGSWCREPEWTRLASYTPRPDSVVQIAHLYDTDRAGTVNLFPRVGVGYNSVVPGRHAGESFHEKDAFVAIWGAPLASRSETSALRSAENGAMPLAIYEYLSGERPERGKDGWGFDPLPADWFPAALALAPDPAAEGASSR